MKMVLIRIVELNKILMFVIFLCPIVHSLNCTVRYECSTTVNWNYVDCINGVCTCLSNLGFSGNGTYCECTSPKKIFWDNSTPYCINLECADLNRQTGGNYRDVILISLETTVPSGLNSQLQLGNAYNYVLNTSQFINTTQFNALQKKAIDYFKFVIGIDFATGFAIDTYGSRLLIIGNTTFFMGFFAQKPDANYQAIFSKSIFLDNRFNNTNNEFGFAMVVQGAPYAVTTGNWSAPRPLTLAIDTTIAVGKYFITQTDPRNPFTPRKVLFNLDWKGRIPVTSTFYAPFYGLTSTSNAVTFTAPSSVEKLDLTTEQVIDNGLASLATERYTYLDGSIKRTIKLVITFPGILAFTL